MNSSIFSCRLCNELNYDPQKHIEERHEEYVFNSIYCYICHQYFSDVTAYNTHLEVVIKNLDKKHAFQNAKVIFALKVDCSK